MMSSDKEITFSKAIKGVKVLAPEVTSEEMERRIKEVKDEAEKEIRALGEGTLKRVSDEFQGLVKEISNRLPGLVMALVERVWGGVVLGQEQVEAIVKEVLEKSAPEGEALEVFLSTEDYDLITGKGGVDFLNRYPEVVLKRDMKLNRGDCLVKSRFGLIDATMETKLKQISQELGIA